MTDYVYVLRCVNANMTSHTKFKWPAEGYVEAPDWNPMPECGNGLHGFLWGEGILEVAWYNNNSKWLVVKVSKEDIVDLGGKVKFPKGEVVFCGSSHEAANHIASFGATGRVHFVHREGGDNASLEGGYYCNLIAGHDSTLTAGHDSTLTAGSCSTLTAGSCSTLTAGDYSTLTAEYGSTLTAGYNSTLKADYNSTLTAGTWSHLTAGFDSTLVAGTWSHLTAGSGSTFSAGMHSVFIGHCNDTNMDIIAVVGQNGIEPNVKYTVKDGKFVPA